jgi:hypothetical protein
VKSGSHLYSAAGDCEVIVVRPPSRQVVLTCGAHPMLEARPDPGSVQAAEGSAVTRIGKRYRDHASGLEVLCVKPGRGELAADGAPLEVATAKPLPASD